MKRLSIVIPAYNEERNIREVVSKLVSFREELARCTGLGDVEILVVDDGSTDRTGEHLKDMAGDGAKSFRVLTHAENLGYGAALKTGFKAATGDCLSFMDADGTISPASFAPLYSALIGSGADMAVGTRFGGGGSKMPWVRRLGNRFFAALLSFLSGEKVRDSASGIRLFRREILARLLPLPDGLHFTPAMSAKAVHEKLRIVEVPIPYSERGGASKLRVVPDGIRFLRIIVGTVLMYNPFKVFLLAGLFCMAAGSALMSVPLYELLTNEMLRFSDYIYRSIGALYFFVVGTQIILFGILARFIVSTFFRVYESGRVIHSVNSVLRVYDKMGLYGAVFLALGVGVNAAYFYEYLFSEGIRMHWVSLLLAAVGIIVGIQMVITGVVMKILRDIKAAKNED